MGKKTTPGRRFKSGLSQFFQKGGTENMFLARTATVYYIIPVPSGTAPHSPAVHNHNRRMPWYTSGFE